MYLKLIFWLKNYGEKWSTKIIFDIPPCAKPFSENIFYFIERRIFPQNCKFSNNKIEGTPILKLAMVKR